MTKKRIVVSERDNVACLFEDDRAVEFIIHRGDMLLGDVYLASVENILPSIDAAFLQVGSEKMAFLHASDVEGSGDLRQRLQPHQRLVVQIMKEPTGHKGPRVTTNISMPGRFLVFMPFSKGISISRKIEDPKERARLKSCVSLLKPPGVGVIIRTEAEGQSDADIQEDLEILMERWQQIVSMADVAEPPTLLYRDQDLLYRVIREHVTDDIEELVVDTQFGFQRATQLLQNWNMDKETKVVQYTGAQSIMVGKGIDKEIRLALNTRVPLPSGGYLYIQPTEALCVIDVNSGKFTSLASQAETIRITNLEAGKEIARQLRLRNIGGMIIVDFIDMESRADKLGILEAFEKELEPDKSKPQVGQLSDLGLVEMTRHRQGQSLSEIFSKKCPSCSGTGHALEDFHWNTTGSTTDTRFDKNRNRMPVRHKGGAPNAGAQQQGQVMGPNGKPLPGRHPGQGGQQSSQGMIGNMRSPQELLMRPKRFNQPAADALQPEIIFKAYINNHIDLAKFAALAKGGDIAPLAGLREKLELSPLASGAASSIPTAPPPSNYNNRGPNRGGPNRPQQQRGLDTGNLVDTIREGLNFSYGLRLANSVKFGITPLEFNGHFSRMNSKANDIFTLVTSIEGGDYVPPVASDDDSDEDDTPDMDDDENGSSGSPNEFSQHTLSEDSRWDESVIPGEMVSDLIGELVDELSDDEPTVFNPRLALDDDEFEENRFEAVDEEEALSLVEEDDDDKPRRGRPTRGLTRSRGPARRPQPTLPLTQQDGDDDEINDLAEDDDEDEMNLAAVGASAFSASGEFELVDEEADEESAEQPRIRRRGRPPKRTSPRG